MFPSSGRRYKLTAEFWGNYALSLLLLGILLLWGGLTYHHGYLSNQDSPINFPEAIPAPASIDVELVKSFCHGGENDLCSQGDYRVSEDGRVVGFESWFPDEAGCPEWNPLPGYAGSYWEASNRHELKYFHVPLESKLYSCSIEMWSSTT